ncbi:MAG: PLDc N-terminal domain-containing protein [Christiangramia sp.]|nr:PLDc N-terminal domain-containing protein [Christiangramia sp.]
MAKLLIVFVFALIILGTVLVIWTILDIFQKRITLIERLLWLILIILTPILGSLIYLFFGRRIQ